MKYLHQFLQNKNSTDLDKGMSSIQYLSDINTDIPLIFRTIIHKNGVQNDRNKPHTHKR